MYQTNILISDKELWERFKESAKEQGRSTSGALETALLSFINNSNPRTRQGIRISKILEKCPPGCKIYEKALFAMVNAEEFVSVRTFENIISDLFYRKYITIHREAGQRLFSFEQRDAK